MPSNFGSRESVLITNRSEVAAGRITLAPDDIGVGVVSLRQLADSSLWLHCYRQPCLPAPRLTSGTLLSAVWTFLNVTRLKRVRPVTTLPSVLIIAN